MPRANKATVSEATARSVRGAVQSGPAFAVVEFIEAFELYNFTDRQYGITIVILASVVSFVQNKLENKRGKGFFLRDVPPAKTTVKGT